MNVKAGIIVKNRISAQGRVEGIFLNKSDIASTIYKVLRSIQNTNPFNVQIKYYMKIYTFNLSINLPYITIHIAIIIHLLTIYISLNSNNIFL